MVDGTWCMVPDFCQDFIYLFINLFYFFSIFGLEKCGKCNVHFFFIPKAGDKNSLNLLVSLSVDPIEKGVKMKIADGVSFLNV